MLHLIHTQRYTAQSAVWVDLESTSLLRLSLLRDMSQAQGSTCSFPIITNDAPLITHAPVPTYIAKDLITEASRAQRLFHRRLKVLLHKALYIILILVIRPISRKGRESRVVSDGVSEGVNFMLEVLHEIFKGLASGLFGLDEGGEGVVVFDCESAVFGDGGAAVGVVVADGGACGEGTGCVGVEG